MLTFQMSVFVMDIRQDFEPVKVHLHRLVECAKLFGRFYHEDWSELKNQGDFNEVYLFPPEQRHALEELYSKGRSFASSMECHLFGFNDVRAFPSLAKYADSFDNLWICNRDEVQEFITSVAGVVDSLESCPGSVREMLELFREQIAILDEVLHTVGRIKQSKLYRIEKGEVPVEREPYIQIRNTGGRININSTDNSINTTTSSSPIFLSLVDAIQKSEIEENLKNQIISSVNSMRDNEGTSQFVDNYKEFIQIASGHYTIIAPFISALTSLLQSG